MGSLTDWAEKELLDHVLVAAFSPTTPVYLALCTSDPTDAATTLAANECANSGSYARTQISFHAAGTHTARILSQNGAVVFPTASGSWGTVSHWAICDSSAHNGGNCLAHGAFSASKAIGSGNTPSVADDEVEVSFAAGEITNYLAHKLLDLMFIGTAYSKPTAYVALATAALADSDTDITAKEPSGGSYARKAHASWNAATGTTPALVDNNGVITFDAATGDWGTITAAGICDAGTTGQLLFYDNDATEQAVNSGDQAEIASGAFDVTMS